MLTIAGLVTRAALAVATVVFGMAARAEDRFALVVGIDAYADLPRLERARADAEAVGATLQKLGFSVDLIVDPGRRAFNRAISTFLNRITPGATVYIHYSGHGVEVDNDTYLVPADMPLPRAGGKEFVKTEAVRLSSLLDSLKATPAAARVLSIDACRDNPFAQKGTRSLGAARGLAVLPAPRGTLIMYSAAQGQTALDRLGPSDEAKTSVYTRSLLQLLAKPGLSMTDVAQEVRRKVEALAATVGHEQRPAYYDELSDRLFLGGRAAVTPEVRPVPPPRAAPAATSSPANADRDAWDAVKDTGSPAVLRAFLRDFPTGFFAGLAKARLGELEAEVAPAPQSSGLTYSYVAGLDPKGDNWLALKSAPNLNATRLMKMGPGTRLSVIGRSGSWLQIRLLDGTIGWAASRYVACCVAER